MNDKLFNPNYLQSLCAKFGLKPSKKYGQNFLIDPEPIKKMIRAAEIKKNDAVIEIGPGFGVLTFTLAEQAEKIIAYEIEKKLENYWRENALENIKIVWGNFLKNKKSIFSDYKVVANLPYQITSAIMRVFLEAENPPEKMVLMVQKEVAERICAKPGNMSLLSVSVQYYAKPEIVDVVPRSNFWPEPAVDSAVIVIDVIKSAKLSKPEDFFRVVKAGFSNRRKLLIRNLESLVGKKRRGELAEVFSKLGLKPTVRAQELGVEEWNELAGKFHNNQ